MNVGAQLQIFPYPTVSKPHKFQYFLGELILSNFAV